MDFTTAIQSIDPKNNLLHYLIQNGSKKKLDKVIVDLERENPNNPFCFQAIMTDDHNKLWELPTRELCLGLIRYLNNLGIGSISELGAGMAMLSALLNHYAKREKLSLKISASSKFGCTFLYDNRFTYYPVVNETFANYRGTPWDSEQGYKEPVKTGPISEQGSLEPAKTGPIIISWLHPLVENELINVIIVQKPQYIFLVGEHSIDDMEGSCQTIRFDKQLQLIGYHSYILPFKQVCMTDYILDDMLRKIPIGVVSRSCTVMYSLELLELNINKIVGTENIGIHHAVTHDYVMQDIRLKFKAKLYE